MMNKIIFFVALIAAIPVARPASINELASPALSRGLFAADLLQQITKPSENIIFSPLSIQSALAMTYLGAAGKTATELQTGLRLQSNDINKVGESFAQILNQKSGEAQLNIANRIFINCVYKLRSEFNKLSKKYFNAEAVRLNFKKRPSESVATINKWVENKTDSKIRNIMAPGSINADTAAVIVNAIYFKGKWQKPFNKDVTRKSPFWIAQNSSVSVDTMFSKGTFKYGEFPELCATAIEMPYKNSNISMIVLLPTQRDGFSMMESKLKKVAINELSAKMSSRSIDLSMPKFKIDFSIGLTNALKAMGIRLLFSDDADLSGILKSGPRLKVSNIQHKGFIEVNEAGSEAAAATVVTITTTSAGADKKIFKVDHPFMFAITSPDAVYFVGHVVKL